jgi:hypothetical protein
LPGQRHTGSRLLNHSGAKRLGDGPCAVNAGAIRNDDFVLVSGIGLRDNRTEAFREVLLLVAAREDDRDHSELLAFVLPLTLA